MRKVLKINEGDNVIVALEKLYCGDKVTVNGVTITVNEDIERGHKMAICDFSEGDIVVKYNYPIGHAKAAIKAGDHVHVHNLATNLSDNLEYSYEPEEPHEACDYPNLSDEKFFMGYERANGKIGIRNELWVIPTVGCVNGNARAIAERCKDLVCDTVDDVVAFNHPYGCSQMGDDQENTRIALANLIRHPNVGGVLVLGLGCENSNIGVLKEYLSGLDESRVRFIVSQDVEDEIEEGCKALRSLAQICSQDKRTKQPVSKLVIGMKCGGSDGLSGITANPVVGAFSDILVSFGGTTILTEVPEMFGAETILLNRARNKEIFDKTVKMVNDFKDYFRNHNQTIYENPSPGNKAGGISTLEDKALGCTQKSGSAQVVDVLQYGERVKEEGLNLLYSPGNDLVASTALAVSDAQMVLFTTGRGTPFACPVPTVKISTNSALFTKKNNWIDYNCGTLVDKEVTIDELSEELYRLVIEVANGKKVKSETSGYCDLAIFKQGVTL